MHACEYTFRLGNTVSGTTILHYPTLHDTRVSMQQKHQHEVEIKKAHNPRRNTGVARHRMRKNREHTRGSSP